MDLPIRTRPSFPLVSLPHQPCLTQCTYDPCRVGPPETDGSWWRVLTWSIGEGNGKPLQYSCIENPVNSMKRQKGRTLKDELPRSVGAQYANHNHIKFSMFVGIGFLVMMELWQEFLNFSTVSP